MSGECGRRQALLPSPIRLSGDSPQTVPLKDSVLPIGSDRHLAENPQEGSPDLLPTRGSSEPEFKGTAKSKRKANIAGWQRRTGLPPERGEGRGSPDGGGSGTAGCHRWQAAGERHRGGKNVMLNARKKKSLETDSVPQEEHQRTVISSDDGAKVLNNLDDLIKEYENSVHTKEKTFIGNAAKALGAKRYGSKSEYATFETVNGNEVTIRLSDHNASVERMDKAGRDNAISIVVTPKPNSGILDDGNAHIVEFYYNAIRLRRAEGKPLVEILKSIKQALYSGEFKDTTGLAEVKVVNADRIRYHRGYHGSGADFESFDHSHMGEGEGAQAYGWGSYVTEVEGIGRAYAESSSRDKRENATVYKRRQIRDNETSINVIQGMIAEYPERQREREKRLAELEKELAGQNGQKDRIEKESGRDSVAYRNFMFYAEDIIKDTERNIARIKNDIRDEAEYNEQRKRQVSELEEENKSWKKRLDDKQEELAVYASENNVLAKESLKAGDNRSALANFDKALKLNSLK